MKILSVSLGVIGLLLIIAGQDVISTARSPDEGIAGSFPILLGLGLWMLDVVIAVLWWLF